MSRPPPEVPDARLMWLRWAWRDLRAHAAAVVAIGLVMAIGTGIFAGLGSTATWRELSNDESFAALGMHDLRVSLSPGTFTREGALVAAAREIDDADGVLAASERLVLDSQIDASTGDESILAVARVVGMDFGTDPPVDAVWVRDGTEPRAGSEPPEALLEAKFADARGLPPSGRLVLAGGVEVDYSGLGMIPEDFFYEGPEGTLFSEGELAPVYLPLADAQRAAGRPGQVNDLVLRLDEGADRDRVGAQLSDAVAGLGVSATVSSREDATAVRVLYEDIENDQRIWNAVAALVLAAAALAVFNLLSRVAEARRREIGIGMALGVPRWQLAARTITVGAQVALLGTLAGIGVGLLVGMGMKNLLESFLPLPEYRTPFQPDVFGRAALLGLAIPLLASALPVWRAVRVEPIQAIRTGHLTAKTGRLAAWTSRLPLPGSTVAQMPLRNMLRTPRRTLLTALSVGAAITALVAVLGLLDSFQRTIDRAGQEITRGDPDRVLVQMDTFYASNSPQIAAIGSAPAVGALDLGLRLPATARAADDDHEDLTLLVHLIDTREAAWTPTLERGRGAGEGILLARKAAADLGVRVGDTLLLTHPVRRADGSFALAGSRVPVDGIHANPLRAFAYMDSAQAGRFGLDGVVNVVDVYPEPGASRDEVQRAVFGLPGVASSQPVARVSEGFDEALEQFVGILVITALAVLALGLLIAFNASRITMEERRRDHATMRAFGLPVRAVMGIVVAEGLLIGILATALGIAAGSFFLSWMLGSVAATTLPDIGIDSYLSPSTLALALAIGIVSVALAPLFLTRRLRRMDIPDTLRVME